MKKFDFEKISVFENLSEFENARLDVKYCELVKNGVITSWATVIFPLHLPRPKCKTDITHPSSWLS